MSGEPICRWLVTSTVQGYINAPSEKEAAARFERAVLSPAEVAFRAGTVDNTHITQTTTEARPYFGVSAPDDAGEIAR